MRYELSPTSSHLFVLLRIEAKSAEVAAVVR